MAPTTPMTQPTLHDRYTQEELRKLKEFVDIVRNDESRATLACWGDHGNYSKGW